MTKDDLTRAVIRYQTARSVMKRPMRDSATEIALALSEERDGLIRVLEKRWRWLDEHPTHDQFTEREDAFLDLLAQYEQTEDVLRHAASSLYGGQAA